MNKILGFGDLISGCLLNTILLILGIIITIVFHAPVVMSLVFIIAPFMFLNGKKLIAKVAGPDIGLWLYTSDIGVSFAYISIGLFRQDKKFTKIEFNELCKYFAKEFGDDVYDIIKQFVIKNKKQRVDLRLHTKKIVTLSFKNRALFLHHLFTMAVANGKYTDEEDLYLRKVAKLLKIGKRNFANIKSNFIRDDNTHQQKSNQKSDSNNQEKKNYSRKQQFYNPSYTAYLSLGLNKFATNEEIKKAYRKLAIKYHPDKLINQSSSEIKIASQKFREITEAYEIIKKERNMK